MKIREYFQERSQRARRLTVGGFIVAVAAAAILVLAGRNLSATYNYVLAGVGVLGVALMFGGMLYLDRTKCPNCLKRLGFQFANQYRFGRRFAFCPFCGIGFDKCEVRNT